MCADSVISTSRLSQPVVILGGFLITEEAYRPLADWIGQATGAPVRIVPASKLDWLATSWGFGWCRLLDRVDAAVRELQSQSPTGRVTLIGHSSGGVMLRPYLSIRPFWDAVSMVQPVQSPDPLGSPHQALRAHRCGHVWIVSFRVALKPIGSTTCRLRVGLIRWERIHPTFEAQCCPQLSPDHGRPGSGGWSGAAPISPAAGCPLDW